MKVHARLQLKPASLGPARVRNARGVGWEYCTTIGRRYPRLRCAGGTELCFRDDADHVR